MGFNEGLVGLQKGLYGVLQGFLGSYRGVSLVSSGFRAVRDWEDDEGFLSKTPKGGFRKLGVPCLGVLIIRILLFRVLHKGPLFSETPICSVNEPVAQGLCQSRLVL